MGETGGDPLGNDLRNGWVKPQRCGDQMTHLLMPSGCFGRQPWDILRPVAPWAKEVRKDHDRAGTTLGASIKGCGKARFGQLHVGWLDNFESRGATKKIGHLLEQLIAFVPLRPMVDHNHSQRQIALVDSTDNLA
jgi:hypothetical protein